MNPSIPLPVVKITMVASAPRVGNRKTEKFVPTAPVHSVPPIIAWLLRASRIRCASPWTLLVSVVASMSSSGPRRNRPPGGTQVQVPASTKAARASLKVVDGRMAAAANAESGW